MQATINGLPPIHPGEYIREVLEELGMTQAQPHQRLGVAKGELEVPEDIDAQNAKVAGLFKWVVGH